jgi:F-type H+-transporting ATPase subunit delta
MLNSAVARRYARAIFELAQEKGVVDQIGRELELVASLFETNREFRAVMNDVLIAPQVKREMLNKLLLGKVSDLTMNFLNVVVRKRREAYLPQMYRAYQDLANEALGIVEVEVRSAVQLPEETVRNLEAKLVSRLGKRVKFQTQVAPELIGGLVVRVGDLLMDGSVKTRLARMHDRLIRSKAD